MKIDDTLVNQVRLKQDAQETAPDKKAKAAASPEAGSNGNVTLSPLVAQLKALEAAANGQQTFDTEKVAAIKAAIRDGQFSINPDKIAAGLIDSVKDLLGTKPA